MRQETGIRRDMEWTLTTLSITDLRSWREAMLTLQPAFLPTEPTLRAKVSLVGLECDQDEDVAGDVVSGSPALSPLLLGGKEGYHDHK